MTAKETFLALCSKIDRAGITDLLAWLEESDFYTAPASTKYHGAYSGGLVEHSLNVYNEMHRLSLAYPELALSEESILITSLFHDLCKVNTYIVETRYRKDAAGKWEPYEAFVHNEKLNYGGHGSKSVFILQNFIRLAVEEAIAINCHMSSWEDNPSVGAAFEHCPLAWLLHVADEAATFITESKK
jgi:hypothetical protein